MFSPFKMITFTIALFLNQGSIESRNLARRSQRWTTPFGTDEQLLQRYQAKLVRNRKNPVDGPLVWIGSSVPAIANSLDFSFSKEIIPESLNSTFSENLKVPNEKRRLARSRNQPLSDEICTTNRYWKQINVTHDIHGREVEIVHAQDFRQYVYVYECVAEGSECSGVSHQLQSTCETRTGWAGMLHRQTDSAPGSEPVWGYVAVPHHCACRISPRVTPLV